MGDLGQLHLFTYQALGKHFYVYLFKKYDLTLPLTRSGKECHESQFTDEECRAQSRQRLDWNPGLSGFRDLLTMAQNLFVKH